MQNYLELFGIIERKLFVDFVYRKKSKSEMKSKYCRKYDITARQFNSICSQIEGKIASIYELKKDELSSLESKVEKQEKFLEKLIVKKEKLHKTNVTLVTFLETVKNS